jgi:hypothetical protein
MSIIGSNILAGASGQAGGGGAYEIERSVRFNSADSAYLSRTPGSAGNRKTWTWAGWVKRVKPGQSIYLKFVQGGSTYPYEIIYFDNTDKLVHIHDNNSFTYQRRTLGVFRDPSAWYHIVFAADTTQATASNRLKIYVNGLQQDTEASASGDMPLNFEGIFNSTTPAYINGQAIGNFYLADNHFIDSQALTPSAFGEFDTNGVWQPKAYSGSYGTNGFRLPFSDNSTAAALGTDTSGNGHTWTVNNISVTAGVGNDSLVDSPSQIADQTDTGVGGEVVGNYCTINPLGVSSNTPTISDGNLQMVLGALQAVRLGTIGVISGKWYWEIVYTAATAFDGMVGVARPPYNLNNYVGSSSDSWGYYYTGVKYNAASSASYGSSWTTGDVMGIALDMDNFALYFSKNGVWQNSGVPTSGASKTGAAYTNLSGEIFPALNAYGGTQVANWGQRAFAYTAPSGFKALCTTNLPEPTIADGSTVMDVKTWTGDGTTGTGSITGFAFSPDFVWAKTRSAANSHLLYDTVRGASTSGSSKALVSNASIAEGSSNDDTTYGYLSSFNSDGFSYFGGSSPVYFSQNGASFVAWTWDAGSSTVTNTAGSITSQVRANASAGFSVVTVNSTTIGTIGHGLGVKPAMIIEKCRGTTSNWYVRHQSLGDMKSSYLTLNTASAAGIPGDTTAWNNTEPTSTTISINNNYLYANGSVVYYCFAPVAGYSSFGSYTGNGSADGPFVYTGFRPRWVLIKNTTSAYDWRIHDTARDPGNVSDTGLFPSGSFAEADSSAYQFDINSNGFKLRTDNVRTNASSNTYIYAAFAEHPFATSRAR